LAPNKGPKTPYTGYKSPLLEIYNFAEAKVISLFNAASIYNIHHTNKFLNNAIEGLGSLVNFLLLRQLESFLLHPLYLCITTAGFSVSRYHKLSCSFYYVNRYSAGGHVNSLVLLLALCVY
jgi:hypothetical protein